MPLKAIAKALGLDEASDETAVLAEINKRAGTITAICQALAIDVSSDEKAIAAAIKTLKDDKATAIAAAQGKVPESALTDVTKKLDEATAEIAALKKTNSDRDIDAALDKAVAAGKITPAARDEYRAMCAAEGGLDRFNKLVAKLPVIGEPTDLDTSGPPPAPPMTSSTRSRSPPTPASFRTRPPPAAVICRWPMPSHSPRRRAPARPPDGGASLPASRNPEKPKP